MLGVGPRVVSRLGIGRYEGLVETVIDAVASTVVLLGGMVFAKGLNAQPIVTGAVGVFLLVVGASMGRRDEFLGSLVSIFGLGMIAEVLAEHFGLALGKAKTA